MNENEIVTFIVKRDTQCSNCKEDLGKHSFIVLENKEPLCLTCADLDHLEFLPSGNTALTRRAKKNSRIYAVAVEWSRSRKRYERQGILVEPSAIEKAEDECLKDADLRKAKQQRNHQRIVELDQKYIERFAQEIRKLYPKCPQKEEYKIAEHACRKHSGRVGRSAAAKEFDRQAIYLAVQAHARHEHTKYDELLMKNWDRNLARNEVEATVAKIMYRWQGYEEEKEI